MESCYWSCMNDKRPPRIIKTQQLSLLLPLLLPVYLSLALSVTAPLSLLLPVLMNFIEWSRRVQAESICALLDCKNPLLFLLMSEFSSSAIFAAAFLCLPPLIVFRFNSVGELKMVWFCKQTWPQTNLSEEYISRELLWPFLTWGGGGIHLKVVEKICQLLRRTFVHGNNVSMW